MEPNPPDQNQPQRNQVEQQLNAIIDPVYGKPMLGLGSLQILSLDGKSVALKAQLATPSLEVQDKLKADITAQLKNFDVQIEIETVVPSRELIADDPLGNVRNILLVMSGKGGVGKSTTAVNLALALKQRGFRVGLLDADIYGPSIPTMLGVSGSPISKDGKRMQPLERFGVKLMSIGFLLESDKQAVIWRGPMLHGALGQFLTDVEWGSLDYLVLDLPPGTGDVALTMAQKLKVTGVVMVTTPQEVALADVYKAVSMCEKLTLPILGIVENMSYFIDSAGVRHDLFGVGGGQKVADYAKAPLIAQMPIAQEVREMGDQGIPIVQSKPDSDISRMFLDLADRLNESVAQHHFERTGGDKLPPTGGPKRLRILR